MIPAPPAPYMVTVQSRFTTWAAMTDVPVCDWGSYFKKASPDRLNAIGVGLQAPEQAGPVTLIDLANEYQGGSPSERCIFTIVKRRKDASTTWYQVRRIDPEKHACHSATVKRRGLDEWAPSPFSRANVRAFTFQAPGDSSPREVLDMAVERGFQK